MPLTEPDLWKLIETWPLPYREERDDSDPPKRLCTRFEHNLRKVGDWTDAASVRITKAYRRFLYLKALNSGPITPPECIDNAWLLHLGFFDNYAALESAVGKPLKHRTNLSEADRVNAYDLGRSLWETEFDAEAPVEIWPPRTLKMKNRVVSLLLFLLWISLIGAIDRLGSRSGGEFAIIVFLVTVLVFLLAALFCEKEQPDTIWREG
jgi:hypothetical protein